MATQASLSDRGFTPLTPHTIALSEASTTWAAEVCRQINDPDEQWFTFLNALAVSGVEQWLEESKAKAGDSYTYKVSTKTATTLQVGQYRLYIAPMGELRDNQVTIPAIANETPNHLYLLVDVNEEASQVSLVGGLRHDQLQESVQENQDYIISTEQFSITPERLLLYLNCLDASALVAAGLADTVSQLTETIATGVINAGKWLQNQLDDVAQQLAWELLSPSPVPSFRQTAPTAANIAELTDELASLGIDIPQTARGAYTTLTIDSKTYRFAALTWQLMDSDQPEWSLSFLLGTSGEPLPEGLTLQVSDEQQILTTKTISPGEATAYIYTQVIGTLDEKFSGEIRLPSGEQIPLPQFEFSLG